MSPRLSCQRVSEVVYLFCDNEMERDLRVSFERHVDACPPCAKQVQFTQQVLLLVKRRCVRRCAPRGLRERILQQLDHRRSLTPPMP